MTETIHRQRAKPGRKPTQTYARQPRQRTTHDSGALAFDDPILGLDVASAQIGWCVLTGETHVGGAIMFPGELGEQLSEYRSWLRDMVTKHRPAVIAYEALFIGPAAINLISYQAVTREALALYVGLLTFIHAATWKKEVCGRGGITTKEKAAGVVQRIIEGKGFKTASLDEADAVALALCARGQILKNAT